MPSLFPYMVLCKTLSSRLKKSRIPSVPLVLTLGLLGGSPSGAAMISAASDTMSRRQCVFLSALTGTISPMFFLSTLRTMGIQSKHMYPIVVCSLDRRMLRSILRLAV